MKQQVRERVCSTFKFLHDLSSNRFEPDWILSLVIEEVFLVRKGKLIFVCAILAERRAKFRTLIRCTHQMALELRIIVVRYLILLVIVLVGVAFVTLIEQKILAGTQIRLGPNFVGY